jgi:hypothetical protein
MLCSGIALAASLMLAFKFLLGIGFSTPPTLLGRWCIGHLFRGTPDSVCTLVVDVFVFDPTMSWGLFVCLRHDSTTGKGVESRRPGFNLKENNLDVYKILINRETTDQSGNISAGLSWEA